MAIGPRELQNDSDGRRALQYNGAIVAVGLIAMTFAAVLLVPLALIPMHYRIVKTGSAAGFSCLPALGLLCASAAWLSFTRLCLAGALPRDTVVGVDAVVGICVGFAIAFILIHIAYSGGRAAAARLAASAIAVVAAVTIASVAVDAALPLPPGDPVSHQAATASAPRCNAGSAIALVGVIPLLLCGLAESWYRPVSFGGRWGARATPPAPAGTAAAADARRRVPEALAIVLCLMSAAWALVGLVSAASGFGSGLLAVAVLGLAVTGAQSVLVCARGCCCGFCAPRRHAAFEEQPLHQG